MNVPAKPLRCLLVEDSEDDALLVLRQLRTGGYDVTWSRVETAEAMRAALDRQTWDLVLSDYQMPHFNGLAALELLRASGLDLPFILVSGTIGEEIAVMAMKAGAHDYLMKDRLTRLVPAVERELREVVERRARQRAERALRLQGAALTAAANAIVITDRDGVIVWINPAFTVITGYTLAEAVGQNPRDLVKSGQVKPAVYEQLWKTILAGKVWHGELINRRKDGGLYSEEQTITPVRGADGAITHFIAIKQDLTERRQAESALHQEQALLSSLITTIPDAIYFKDRQSRFLRISDSMARSFGLVSPAAAIGKTDFDYFTEEHARPAFEGEQRMMATGEPIVALEEKETRPDGRITWVSTTKVPVRDAEGRITGLVGMSRDITAQKAGERRLREQNEILSHSHEGVMIASLANEISLWNRGAEAIFGWTEAEALGRSPTSLFGRNELGDVPTMDAALERDGFWSGELRAQARDGRDLVIDCRTTLVRDEAGQPRARLSFFADITEKKLLEEKFLHVQRLESIGMLAAGIAHDLNNVLAPIVFAAPMLRDSLSTARDLKILDTLEQSAARGAGLVKQILGFVHSSGGDFRPTQVKHLARDVVSIIEQTFPKSIVLEHEIPSNLWPVSGNATQIHQVLLNLCVNARDAMPQGGTLRLAAANRRLDAAEAGAIPGARPGAWLMLEVSDTGTGIPPEVLERIWTPFFTTKGPDKGTGLGLSTVRGIVTSHHGFVELQSTVGAGSTFRAFFPAIESESGRAASATPFALPVGQGELILVVEDDAPIRQIVTGILGKHGYRVVSCSDGVEAITVFSDRPSEFSLVVTDVDMPRLGGVALARTLLQLRSDIRLLGMSGLSRNEAGGSDVPAIQELVHAFLLKPFNADELLGTVDRLLHPPAQS